MTAPMVIIELVVMGAMYANKRLNTILIAGSVVEIDPMKAELDSLGK